MRSLFQIAEDQDRDSQYESFAVAVVSKSPLIRYSIARKLGIVGIEVSEHRHFDSLFHTAGSSPPDLVLIDTQYQELDWKALVSLLKIFHPSTHVILLASGMDAEQAADAARNGVAAIFIKPFKEEKHTERVLELLYRFRRITPKRLLPRFNTEQEAQVCLEYLPIDHSTAVTLAVMDISHKGAGVALPRGLAAELEPGSSGCYAALVIRGAEIPVRFRVVHREGRRMGIFFEHLGGHGAALTSFLSELTDRAFGKPTRRARW
jgi:DNA-binding NarL/FixJ family response regulator